MVIIWLMILNHMWSLLINHRINPGSQGTGEKVDAAHVKFQLVPRFVGEARPGWKKRPEVDRGNIGKYRKT